MSTTLTINNVKELKVSSKKLLESGQKEICFIATTNETTDGKNVICFSGEPDLLLYLGDYHEQK